MKIKLRALEMSVFQTDKKKNFFRLVKFKDESAKRTLKNAGAKEKIQEKIKADLKEFHSFIECGEPMKKSNAVNAALVVEAFKIPRIKFYQIKDGGLKRFHLALDVQLLSIEEFKKQSAQMVLADLKEILEKI